MGDHEEKLSDGGLELPPGFHFHPNDEEIIIFYLMPKVHQKNFTCTIIGEVDFNRTEPWELPDKAKMDEDWYFFHQKDRKYPTGMRTNRATEGGYWKATSKDKEIYKTGAVPVQSQLIGMKKTLVFYKGRAPKGEKTEWIMHEFRLEGSDKIPLPTSSSTSATTMKSSSSKVDEWVVCRVFHKTTGKKALEIPPYNIAMDGGEIDQSTIPMSTPLPMPMLMPMPMPMPMPLPLQFPMLSNFTMDQAASYYSAAGTSSSLVPSMITPMEGTSRVSLQMNNTLFGNPMAMVSAMSSYNQVGMGAADVGSFMDAPKNMPSSMVSQKDTGMNCGDTNTANISSMVSVAPELVPTMDMDGIWKH